VSRTHDAPTGTKDRAAALHHALAVELVLSRSIEGEMNGRLKTSVLLARFFSSAVMFAFKSRRKC
jgi:hypothetical protein